MKQTRTRRWKAVVAAVALALTVGGAGAAVAQSTEPVPSADPSAAPSAAPDATDTVPGAGQSDPHKNDIWVPDWILLVIAGAVIAAAVSLATQSYLRFTRTRRELEG